MKILHLIVKGRIPSKKNNRPGFANRGRIPLTAEFKDWQMQAGLQILKYKGSNIECADIQLSFWMPDNRRTDLDNKITSIFDLLKDMEIIKGDHWQALPSFYVRCNGIDKVNPRCELWIREIKNEI